MPETTQKLGFDASQAITAITQVAKELGAYNQNVQTAAKSTSAYNQAGRQFDQTMKAQARAIKTFVAGVGPAQQAINKLSNAQAQIKQRIDAVTTAATRQADALTQQALQAEKTGDAARSHRLIEQAIQAENVALKKAVLLEQQLIRARERANQIRQDPRQIQAPTGQAAIEQTVRQIAAAKEASAAQQKQLRDDARKTEVALRNAFRGTGEAAEEASKKGVEAGNAVLLSWRSVVRIFTIQVIHTAISRITSAFRESITEAREFGIALAEIQTISGSSFGDFDGLSDSLKNISNQFGQQASVIAEGLYQTLSNQVGSASESLGFLETASTFATAAVTDTGSAVNLLSSVVNAFGLAASDAEDVAGKLFKTIELGRLRAEEIANTFGRIAVLSNQLGVSLDETLAAMATLTVQGLRYNEAFTLIQNAQLKLIRPTEGLKAAFKELGVTTAEAGIQAFGFQGFLEQLRGTTNGTASEMGELFGRVRAIRGVLGLTGDAAERFKANLDAITAAGDETLQAAAAKVFATDAKQFEVELTKVKNAFLGVGETVISVFTDISKTFGGAANVIETVFTAAGAAGVAYAALLATKVLAAQVGFIATTIRQTVAVNGLTGALGRAAVASRAALATPLGAAIALGLAIAALATYWRSVEQAAKDAEEAQLKAIDSSTDRALANNKKRRADTEKTEKAILANLQRNLQARQVLYQKDVKNAEILQNAVFGGLADQIEDRLSVFDAFVNRLGDAAQDTEKKIKDLKTELALARDEAEQFNFDRSTRNLDPVAKTFAEIERSSELLNKAEDARRAGNEKLAKSYESQALSQAKAAVSSADQSENAAAIFRAEQAVNAVFEAREEAREDEIKQQERLRKEAEKLRPQEEKRNTLIKAAVEEFKKFKLIADGVVVDPDINITEAQAEAAALAGFIQEEIAKGARSAEILSQFDPEFKKIRDKLAETFTDPLSGKQIGNLENLVDISAERIVSILSQQANQLSDSQKLQFAEFLNLDFDDPEIAARGFGEAQARVSQLPESQKAAIKQQNELITGQGSLRKSIIETNKGLETLGATFERVAVGGFQQTNFLTDGINNVLLASNAFDEARGDVNEDVKAAADIFKTIVDAANEVQTIAQQDIIEPEQAARATELIDGIRQKALLLADQGLGQVAQEVNSVADGLKNSLDLGAGLTVNKDAGKILDDTTEKIKGLNGAAGEAVKTVGEGFSEAAALGRNAFEKESQRIIAAAKAEEAAFKARNDEAARGPGGGGGDPATSGERHFGGGLFRRDGGVAIFADILKRQRGGATVRLGTDNVLASLTRGESVNTVESTRRFFPQIQAMNTGIPPMFRKDGGTTTTIGDISITVNEAATPTETSREVMSAINRQIRRGTFNLRKGK